jgi:D-glycero-D-manno-heptose 1,7-bisphosphate phosphatase
MKKAVFLDRDGIINFEPGKYTCNVDDFIINEGIGNSIKLLRDNGFLVIIISNQGGIAKSLYNHEDVMQMHLKFCKYLENFNTIVDDFFYCPHHESVSKCLCRKPSTLMFEKAVAIYNIDVNSSFMIGDGDRDVESAEKAGIKGIKVLANSNIYELCKSIILKS